jgi:hypothetical protein
MFSGKFIGSPKPATESHVVNSMIWIRPELRVQESDCSRAALKRLSKESARDDGLTSTESARVLQDMEKRLLNAKDVDGRLPWMVAQEYGHEELASYLFLRAELVSLRDSFSLQVQRARKGG